MCPDDMTHGWRNIKLNIALLGDKLIVIKLE